jgi:four helix bundle protein
MSDYRSLRVWKRSHELTLEVYKETVCFPAAERYGLVDQMRRAAASVAANLAEGAGRESRAEFVRFCRISMGSLNELEYHLLLSRDLGYLDVAVHSRLAGEVSEVRRMLARLVQRLGRTGNW